VVPFLEIGWHISGKTRRGKFTIHRKTSRKKFQAKLAELKEMLSRRRHDDLAKVGGCKVCFEAGVSIMLSPVTRYACSNSAARSESCGYATSSDAFNEAAA
jgi:hypothetical protein